MCIVLWRVLELLCVCVCGVRVVWVLIDDPLTSNDHTGIGYDMLVEAGMDPETFDLENTSSTTQMGLFKKYGFQCEYRGLIHVHALCIARACCTSKDPGYCCVVQNVV
jgi:hypothetical protein